MLKLNWSSVSPEGGAGTGSEHEQVIARVESILRRRSEIQPRDHRIAALLLVRSIESLVRWLVHTAPTEVDRLLFVRELEQMLVGYLITDA